MLQWGELSLAVTSASITSFLDDITRYNIILKSVDFVDDLKIRLTIKATDYQPLCKIALKRGDQIQLLHNFGVYYFLIGLLKRPVIVFSIILWLFLVVFLPGRILFLQVEGNQLVSDNQILSAAQQCGVQFGASCRYVKSEKVKNALLSQIDQLKWVGVNTKGCVATISVKEGVVMKNKPSEHNFGNVIAICDGVITDITVTAGNPLCKVGQAVRKDQVLVSGYTDCGLHIKTGEVNAEILGITRRDVSAIAMYPSFGRGEISTVKSYYSIQFGKNIINLKKCSGILDAGCVKMYERKALALPGGFYLPVLFIKETVIAYKDKLDPAVKKLKFDWIEDAVENICVKNMLAGEILQKTTDVSQDDNGYHYWGYYVCKEMIGKVCTEEMFIKDGKRNS